jgi:hypothetical protein
MFVTSSFIVEVDFASHDQFAYGPGEFIWKLKHGPMALSIR